MRSAAAYSPSLGCDAELDGWCQSNCGRSEALVARQPSVGQGGAPFACYAKSQLELLDGVTGNLSSGWPNLCGRKSAEYVHRAKQTREQLELTIAFQTCVRARNRSDAQFAPRRAEIARLHQPLLRSRQTAEAADADAAAPSYGS